MPRHDSVGRPWIDRRRPIPLQRGTVNDYFAKLCLADAAVSAREPQCSNSSISFPSASAFDDVHNCLAQWAQQTTSAPSCPPLPTAAQTAIRNLNLPSVVIFGHSVGGEVAIDLITGKRCGIAAPSSKQNQMPGNQVKPS